MKRITIIFGAGLLILCSMVFAAVPQLINFQGILRDGSGNPMADGSYSVDFTIYDAATGGTNLWSETQSVTIVNGLFTILLGSAIAGNEIPDTVFNNPDRWLGIKVGADPEMTPRQKLVSVGYGYRTGSVDGATGGSINGSLSFGNSSSPMHYIYESGFGNPTRPVLAHSPGFPDWGLAYDDVNDRMVFQRSGSPVMTVDLLSSRVGIGTTAPTENLEVAGNLKVTGSIVGSTPWTSFPFASGFGNDGFFQNAQYRKIGDIVYLRGNIHKLDNTGIGGAVGTLPPGFRPPAYLQFAPYPQYRLDINPNGDFEAYYFSGSTISLNGVFFSTSP